MTRTLLVTNDFPPRPGGIEQFLGNVVRRLDPDQVRVVTSRWEGDLAHDRAQPWRTDRAGRRPLLPTPGLAAAVRRAAREHDAEVVLFGVAWPLAELAPAVGLPSLAMTAGHEAGMANFGLGRLITRIADRVDALGVISRYTRSELGPWIDGRAPIFDLPPGVDLEQYTPSLDGGPVRARHGIAPEAPLVVCISRLVHRKGQDVLLEAWPRVLARVPGARLLLVGTGPLEGALRKRIVALGLEHVVRMAGEVDWAELPHYHAAADLFAMPCRTRLGGLDVEGLGIVYLEAQACGVPVIAGRSGGAPEAVLDAETGLVVDGASAWEVAQAVAELLLDTERRVAMGKAGRAFVERSYSWGSIIARLSQILEDVAAQRRTT